MLQDIWNRIDIYVPYTRVHEDIYWRYYCYFNEGHEFGIHRPRAQVGYVPHGIKGMDNSCFN